jgi:hypothetical protein
MEEEEVVFESDQQEVELSEEESAVESPLKNTIESTMGGKVTTEKKPGRKPLPSQKEEEEEEDLTDKISGKLQDKIQGEIKGKVEDKAKELLGDADEGKEELGDALINAANRAREKRNAAGVTVGQKASQVSTAVASNSNVAPVNVSSPNVAVATNRLPGPTPTAQATQSASQTAQRIANGGGRSAPPPSAVPLNPTRSASNRMLGEALTYAKELSTAVLDGAKGSKNIRMLGLTTALGVAGWASGRMKDTQKKQQQEYNRQEAIRQSLMSDG